MSATVNGIGPVEPFGGMNRFFTSEIDGGVFGGGGGGAEEAEEAAVTVRTNVSVAVNPPASVTVRVMVAVPDCRPPG